MATNYCQVYLPQMIDEIKNLQIIIKYDTIYKNYICLAFIYILNFIELALCEDQLANLHGCQIDNRNHRRDGLNVHLLLKIGLRLPGAAIYHCHALVPGDADGVNMSAMQDGRRPGDDIMVFMLRCNGYATAVNWR